MDRTIQLSFLLLLLFALCAHCEKRVLDDDYDSKYVIYSLREYRVVTARLVGIIIHTMQANPRRNGIVT